LQKVQFWQFFILLQEGSNAQQSSFQLADFLPITIPTANAANVDSLVGSL